MDFVELAPSRGVRDRYVIFDLLIGVSLSPSWRGSDKWMRIWNSPGNHVNEQEESRNRRECLNTPNEKNR